MVVGRSSRLGRVILPLLVFFLAAAPPQVVAPHRWFFDEPGVEVVGFLLEGLAPRTRTLYRQEFARFSRAVGGEEIWKSLAPHARDCLVSQYLVRGYKEPDDSADKLSRTQAGYLIST